MKVVRQITYESTSQESLDFELGNSMPDGSKDLQTLIWQNDDIHRRQKRTPLRITIRTIKDERRKVVGSSISQNINFTDYKIVKGVK